MDLILSFIALMVSMTTNVYLVKKLAGSMKVEVTLPEQKVEVVLPPVNSEPEPIVPPTVKKGTSHGPWVNRSGIPLNETNRPPSHGSKPPTSGPLERPAGFVR